MPLREVLEDEKLRDKFKAFVESRGGLENLLLYETIVLYEGIPETEKDFRNHTAQKIVTFFIMDESQYWVNLSAVVRDELLEMVESKAPFEAETFEPAKKEVLQLMEINYLHAFLRDLAGEESSTQNYKIKYKVTPGTFAKVAEMLRGAYRLKQKNWKLPIREPSDGEGSSDSFRG